MKQMLTAQDLQTEYSLSRDLSLKLVALLPHVSLGRSGKGEKFLVRRADVDRFMTFAVQGNHNLWHLANALTAARIQDIVHGVDRVA